MIILLQICFIRIPRRDFFNFLLPSLVCQMKRKTVELILSPTWYRCCLCLNWFFLPFFWIAYVSHSRKVVMRAMNEVSRELLSSILLPNSNFFHFLCFFIFWPFYDSRLEALWDNTRMFWIFRKNDLDEKSKTWF